MCWAKWRWHLGLMKRHHILVPFVEEFTISSLYFKASLWDSFINFQYFKFFSFLSAFPYLQLFFLLCFISEERHVSHFAGMYLQFLIGACCLLLWEDFGMWVFIWYFFFFKAVLALLSSLNLVSQPSSRISYVFFRFNTWTDFCV